MAGYNLKGHKELDMTEYVSQMGGGMKGQGFLSLLAHNRNLFTGIINRIGIMLSAQ